MSKTEQHWAPTGIEHASARDGVWSGPDYGPNIEVERLSNVTVAPDGEILAPPREPQAGASLLFLRYGAKHHQPARGLPIWLLYEASKQLRRTVVVPGAGLEPARP